MVHVSPFHWSCWPSGTWKVCHYVQRSHSLYEFILGFCPQNCYTQFECVVFSLKSLLSITLIPAYSKACMHLYLSAQTGVGVCSHIVRLWMGTSAIPRHQSKGCQATLGRGICIHAPPHLSSVHTAVNLLHRRGKSQNCSRLRAETCLSNYRTRSKKSAPFMQQIHHFLKQLELKWTGALKVTNI